MTLHDEKVFLRDISTIASSLKRIAKLLDEKGEVKRNEEKALYSDGGCRDRSELHCTLQGEEVLAGNAE